MKKKTLFIINDGVYPFKTGGMEVFNYFLLKELKERCELTYIATEEYSFTGLEFVKLPKLPLQRVTTPLCAFFYLLCHKNIRNIVLSYSSAHWLMWLLYGLIIKLLSLNTITVIHHGKNVPCEHFGVYNNLFNYSNHVIAVSEDIKQKYDEAFGIDCKVLYPLIPFEASKINSVQCREIYGIPQNARVFSMVGSLKCMKNPLTILQALKDMTDEELYALNPYVVYAGEGHMRSVIEKFILENNLLDRVRLLGNLPNSKIRDVMTLTDVYVIASDFEGTSVSLLEAMYNSKIIIASNVPGIRDMILNNVNGYLFEVKNHIDLKNCMFKCKEYSEKHKCMGKQAREYYEKKYNHTDMINEYVALINR